MAGPHTKVRVDAGAASPDKAGKPGRGAQQTGLAKFYKGAFAHALHSSAQHAYFFVLRPKNVVVCMRSECEVPGLQKANPKERVAGERRQGAWALPELQSGEGKTCQRLPVQPGRAQLCSHAALGSPLHMFSLPQRRSTRKSGLREWRVWCSFRTPQCQQPPFGGHTQPATPRVVMYLLGRSHLYICLDIL